MTPLKVKRIGSHSLPLPAYAKEGDAGMDLRAHVPGIRWAEGQGLDAYWNEADGNGFALPPGTRTTIGCGFAFAIPEGFEGQVRPRSGHSRRGIYCALGTIDSGYRGEVGVILTNMSDESFIVWEGDRIAQLVIAPVARCELLEVAELDVTDRGADGWGSTGTS